MDGHKKRRSCASDMMLPRIISTVHERKLVSMSAMNNPSRRMLNAVYSRVGHSLRRTICNYADVVENHHPKTDVQRAKTSLLRPCTLKGSLAAMPCDVKRYYSQKNDNQETTPTNNINQLDLSILDMDVTRINAFAKTPEDMEVLVDQLEDVESLTHSDIRLLITPLVQLCSTFQEKDKAAELAERILFNCLARIPSDIATRFQDNPTESESDSSTAWPYPNQELYTKVMKIVGALRSEDAANRVNRLFRLMAAEYHSELLYMKQAGKNPDDYAIKAAAPSMSTFKSLLRAWAVAGTAIGTKEAEDVLVKMEELSGRRGYMSGSAAITDKPDDVRSFSIQPPDHECYNMVLTSYSKVNLKRHPLVVDRVFALFRRMQQLENAGHFSLDWFSYNAYLRCIQAIMDNSKESLDDTIAGELERIIPPLATVTVPKGFSYPYHAGKEGVHPRAWAFGMVIKALLHKTLDEARIRTADRLIQQRVGESASADFVFEDDVPHSELWPSAETLVVLDAAWRQSQLSESKDAFTRIQSWATQSSYPTLHHMHMDMEVWEDSQSPQAPHIVRALLDGTMDTSSRYRPNGRTFAIAMRIWMRSNEPNRGSIVEDFLSMMYDKFDEERDKRYTVNETHIDLVLQAWQGMSKDGKRYAGENGFLYPAQHACAHLDIIQGSKGWDPRNSKHYNTCIKAWSDQVVDGDDHDTFPAREAASLLAEMEHRSGEYPPIPHCNMVLQACARVDIPPTRRAEAYEIALDIFNKADRNTLTYILAVVVAKRSMSELNQDRVDFIASVVRMCRDSGHLTQRLIIEAIEVLGKAELASLFHLTESYADMIVENRSARMVRGENGKDLRWTGELPQGLKIGNIARSWSRNTRRK
eukprot:scaffold5795_cov165-Amphora_coffeaeformis.AAC.12